MSDVHQTVVSQYSRATRAPHSSSRQSQRNSVRYGSLGYAENLEHDGAPEHTTDNMPSPTPGYSEHWRDSVTEINNLVYRLRALLKEEVRISSSLDQLLSDRIRRTRRELDEAERNYKEAVELREMILELMIENPLHQSEAQDSVDSSPSDDTPTRSQPLPFDLPSNISHSRFHPQNRAQRSPILQSSSYARPPPTIGRTRSSLFPSPSIQPDLGPSSEAPSRQTTMSDDLRSQTSINPRTLAPSPSGDAPIDTHSPSSPLFFSSPGPSIPSVPPTTFAREAQTLTVPRPVALTSTSPTNTTIASGSTLPSSPITILSLSTSVGSIVPGEVKSVHKGNGNNEEDEKADQSGNSSREANIITFPNHVTEHEEGSDDGRGQDLRTRIQALHNECERVWERGEALSLHLRQEEELFRLLGNEGHHNHNQS